MRRGTGLVGVLVATFMIMTLAGTAVARLIPPNRFYGDVTVWGNPAPDGTVVSARSGGEIVASTTTESGHYVLDVPAKENTYTVEFYVSDVSTGQTHEVVSGEFTPLDLALTDNVAPTSSVDAISPYWRTSIPFTITVTASDALSGVVRVALWYRYSTDNSNWGAWTWFENDTASPWGWTFTAPSGNGYYEFYSTARDTAGNEEAAPAVADARCGVALGVPDFFIGVSPVSGSVVQGESTTATVSVSSIEGFSETVSLIASGLPSGATATFSPSSGTPSFTSTITISTASTTPGGTYTITITGTGGEKTHTTTYTLTVTTVVVPGVPDFSIGVSPASGSVAQGGFRTATVSVSSIEGFSSAVSLSASGLPSGATASFSPFSGTPSFTSTITISTIATTPTGTYSITITGTGGGKTHSTTYTLTVTAAPPKPFPWELVIGIIAAIVIVIIIVALLYRRRR